MRSLFPVAVALACLMLSGCVAPMMAPHYVDVTASKPGATVFHAGKSCSVPCRLDVRDDFGFYSHYEFVAAAGDRRATQSFDEPTWMHAQGVVPPRLHFDLGN